MQVKRFMIVSAVFIAVAALLAAVSVRPIRAQDMSSSSSASGNAEVMAKLDEILKNQKDTLQQLDNVKEELKIIKIRVTQGQ